MVKFVQRSLFNTLSLDNYLRLLQRSYFVLYNTNMLKASENYGYHYFVKNLVQRGDTIIDIGANLGYYSLLFAKWAGEEGKVYSVEPISIYNKIFNEKAKRFKNITLYAYALGTEEKEIEMVSSPNTGYLKTGLPHVYDANRDGDIDKQEFRFKAEMKVPSKLFAPLHKIDYIKCDIEGFEYIVLTEMKDIIQAHLPKVQVEVWGDNEKAMIAFFAEMGYIPFKLSGNKLVAQKEIVKAGTGDYIFIHKEDATLSNSNLVQL